MFSIWATLVENNTPIAQVGALSPLTSQEQEDQRHQQLHREVQTIVQDTDVAPPLVFPGTPPCTMLAPGQSMSLNSII